MSVKRGFTIVELMVVVAIIGVLMGVVTTAASSSMKQARIHKADMLCSIVQAGIANYHAQKEDWPVSMPTESGELNASQVKNSVKALLTEAKKNNPMMDISGLYVSRNSGVPKKQTCPVCKGTRYAPPGGYPGMDFMDAIRGTKQSRKKMTSSEMYFGYPHPDNGAFMPFRMVYNAETDSLTVSKWHWEN